MINKFQQGGKQDEAIMLFVQGIAQALLADPQLVVQIAQQNPEALKAAILVFLLTQDIKLAAQTFAQAVQQKTQAARHGAKLNYIKSLKHQCAEDEEVYYYKKGGSVGCGCRKKEDGGEILKAQSGTAVSKFKLSRKPNPYASESEKKFLASRDKTRLNNQRKEEVYKNKIANYNKQYLEDLDANAGDAYPPSARGKKPVVKKSCGSKLKKHFNGGSLNLSFLKN